VRGRARYDRGGVFVLGMLAIILFLSPPHIILPAPLQDA